MNSMTRSAKRFYGGADPGEMPFFPIPEAARFLWVREKALRRWAIGEAGRRPFIRVQDPSALSFLELAELHVLSFLRDQTVSPQKIRRAVEWMRQESGGHPHPLLAMDVLTDGMSVFVNAVSGQRSSLVNASQHGQVAMRELIEAHLKRFDRDAKTNAVLRLHPFAWKVRSAKDADSQPKPITIDPLISFGRPVITGTRVPTAEVAERVGAGESMQSVAEDMGLDLRQIEDALRYHLQPAVAA